MDGASIAGPEPGPDEPTLDKSPFPILNLPPELVQRILRCLSHRDAKKARQACRALEKLAWPRMMRTVALVDFATFVHCFQTLILRPDIRTLVRAVKVHPAFALDGIQSETGSRDLYLQRQQADGRLEHAAWPATTTESKMIRYVDSSCRILASRDGRNIGLQPTQHLLVGILCLCPKVASLSMSLPCSVLGRSLSLQIRFRTLAQAMQTLVAQIYHHADLADLGSIEDPAPMPASLARLSLSQDSESAMSGKDLKFFFELPTLRRLHVSRLKLDSSAKATAPDPASGKQIGLPLKLPVSQSLVQLDLRPCVMNSDHLWHTVAKCRALRRLAISFDYSMPDRMPAGGVTRASVGLLPLAGTLESLNIQMVPAAFQVPSGRYRFPYLAGEFFSAFLAKMVALTDLTISTFILFAEPTRLTELSSAANPRRPISMLPPHLEKLTLVESWRVRPGDCRSWPGHAARPTGHQIKTWYQIDMCKWLIAVRVDYPDLRCLHYILDPDGKWWPRNMIDVPASQLRTVVDWLSDTPYECRNDSDYWWRPNVLGPSWPRLPGSDHDPNGYSTESDVWSSDGEDSEDGDGNPILKAWLADLSVEEQGGAESSEEPSEDDDEEAGAADDDEEAGHSHGLEV